MSTIAGIDLGTTNSALAVLNQLGKPEIVPDFDSNRIVPSVVGFSSPTSAVIGVKAKNLLATNPDNVVQFVKRQMGNPSYSYKIFGKSYSPVDISALILKKLKEECVEQGEIKDVVITVPAHFDEVQRKSTMDAGKIAGLNVLGIINEPTAAALYYASISQVNGNVIVYDLGGGTFDVTIIKMNGNNVDVLTSKGDGHLGGMDFDHEIVKFINEEAKKQLGEELFLQSFLNNPKEKLDAQQETLYQKAMATAENAKKALSVRPSARIAFVTPMGNVRIELTRENFEEMISSYIATTEMLLENALEDAKLTNSDISKILLVGGSTRIPMVSRSLEKTFGISVEKAVNVDEAVALGAAISAGIKKLSKDGTSSISAALRSEISKTNILETCNKNFGTLALAYNEKLDREMPMNTTILKKNTKLPCFESKDFSTITDNQKCISVVVTESEEESSDPDLVSKIGEFKLNLPENTKRGSLVKISYGYDENQRLKCTVQIPGGDSYKVEIGYSENGTYTQSEISKKQASMNDFIVE